MQTDRACERRMAELAARAAKTGAPQRTGFLTPAERAQADICARQAGTALFTFGGTEDAERRVVAFADADWTPEWPVCCVRIEWNAKFGDLGHRDILGALLALGIDREKVGDIHPGGGQAHAFMLPEMARYAEANLDRAGNVPVAVRVLPPDEAPQLAVEAGKPVRGTVASLRLDAVLGVAWNLSRGRAAELVAAGRVQVEYQLEMKPDRQVPEGAVLSVRGLGRAKLDQIGGRTKKDRIGITLTRY